MVGDVRSDAWLEACKSVAAAFSKPPFRYDEYRGISQGCGLKLYNGKLTSYNSTRFLRSLAFAARGPREDHPGDWTALSRMGNGVRKYGLEYATAVDMANAVRQAGVPLFSLSDLACFLCLAKEPLASKP